MVTQARTNKNVGYRNGERLRVQGATRATRATRGHKGHKWWMARFDWQHLLRLSCASAGWSDHSCGWLRNVGAVKVQLTWRGLGTFFCCFCIFLPRILYAMMHRSWGVSLRQRSATQDCAAGALRRGGRNSWWFTLLYLESSCKFLEVLIFAIYSLFPTWHTEERHQIRECNVPGWSLQEGLRLFACVAQGTVSPVVGFDWKGALGHMKSSWKMVTWLAIEAIEARTPSEKCKISSRRRIPSRECLPRCLALRLNDWRIEVD